MKWLDGTVEGMIPMMIGTKIDIPVNSSMQLKNNINEEEWDTYPATLKEKRSMYLHMIEAQTYGLSKEWVELNHKALALCASHMGRPSRWTIKSCKEMTNIQPGGGKSNGTPKIKSTRKEI